MNNFVSKELIDYGWSYDKKYKCIDEDGTKYLLKECDIKHLNRKQYEFDVIKKIFNNTNINMSEPISIEYDHEKVSVLFSYIEGERLEEVLPFIKKETQYEIGVEAGEYLYDIHNVPCNEEVNFKEKMLFKYNRNKNNYFKCNIPNKDVDDMIIYCEKHIDLLEECKVVYNHGDYHVGNMIINDHNELGIIDFNRLDVADYIDDFSSMIFSYSVSKEFCRGLIDGYFKDSDKARFYKLHKLIVFINAISMIPWSISYGKEEVNRAIIRVKETIDYFEEIL